VPRPIELKLNLILIFYTYILKNKDENIYIGYTQNLEKRLYRHNNNQEISTKNRGPWIIIYSKIYETRSLAMKKEKN